MYFVLLILDLAFSLFINYMMSYNSPWWQVSLISLILFAYTILVLKSKKRFIFFWLFIIALLLVACLALYDKGILDTYIDWLKEFVLIYVNAIQTGNIYLDNLPLFVFSVFVYSVLHHVFYWLFLSSRIDTRIFYILAASCVVGGEFINCFRNVGTQPSFLFLIFSLFFLYFYKQQPLKKQTFFSVAIACSILVIFGATVLHNAFPDPFKKRVIFKNNNSAITSTPSANPSDDNEDLPSVYSYDYTTSFELSTSFEPQYLPLMTAETFTVTYLKANVFERYENNVWYKDDTLYSWLDTQIEYDSSSPLHTRPELSSSELVTITCRNLESLVLFSNSYYSEIVDETQALSISYDLLRNIYLCDQLLTEGDTYSFEAITPNYNSRLLATALREADSSNQSDYLSSQELDKQLIAKAQEITENHTSSIEKVLAIQNYLRENYTYDMTPYSDDEENNRERISDDYVTDFLFNNPYGFCQHYASSMTLMLQSLGIPARYVTGFLIERMDESEMENLSEYVDVEMYTGHNTITDANAHAWVEVYFNDIGWLVFEPTGAMPSYTYLYEDPSTSTNPTTTEATNSGLITMPFIIIIGAILILFILGCLVLCLRKSATPDNLSKLLITYKQILKRLSALQVARHTYETSRVHALRVDSQIKLKDIALMSLIVYYEQCIYGQSEPSDEQLLAFEHYKHAINAFIIKDKGFFRYLCLLLKR